MSDLRQVPLSEVVTRVTTKNVDGTYQNVLTVSAEHGLIAQESFFTKKVASSDTSGYYVVAPGQFVYNKSTSKSAAYGTVARNLTGEPGIVSPLYFVFEANDGAALPEYLELALNSDQFFGSLAGTLREGARTHGLLNVRLKEFYAATVTLPPTPVQERITTVIGAMDDQITALDAEADTLAGVYLAATSLLWLTSQGNEAESRPLGDVMHLDVVRIPMKAGTTYHLAGVLNAGKGLVDKDEFDGADTEYTAMNVLRENQVVMRKLTAWEGPITVVTAEFDGFVASNEFPTFTLADDIAPGWMKHVCRTPRLWAEMQSRVVGTVQRRKRLNPDQLLSVALPVPSRPQQEKIAEALDAIEGQLAVIRAESARLRQARAGLLSGLLDRTIDIESAELRG
jgi:type I restriction enzyme S subunit